MVVLPSATAIEMTSLANTEGEAVAPAAVPITATDEAGLVAEIWLKLARLLVLQLLRLMRLASVMEGIVLVCLITLDQSESC